MSGIEKFPEFDSSPDSADEESLKQYETASNHKLRKFLYNEYAVPKIGFNRLTQRYLGIDGEIINAMGLHGSETMADIGCGDGAFIDTLIQEYSHTGHLYGLNNVDVHYLPMQQKYEDQENVEFIECDARDLPLEDNSVDSVLLGYFLYHLDHPEQAIDEADRILKPGGKIVIGSRNPGNQAKLWSFLGDISDELKGMSEDGYRTSSEKNYTARIAVPDYSDISPPETFYRRFDLDRAKQELLSRGFDITESYIQSSIQKNSVLKLPNEPSAEAIEDAWGWYELTLCGLMTVFKGTPIHGGDMLEAVRRRVKPAFYKEVAEKGYFEEYVEQGFVVASKR